jgi:hypothetical protein
MPVNNKYQIFEGFVAPASSASQTKVPAGARRESFGQEVLVCKY